MKRLKRIGSGLLLPFSALGFQQWVWVVIGVVLVAHVAIFVMGWLLKTADIKIPAGAQVTLPAVATSPRNPQTQPALMAAAAVPAAGIQPASESTEAPLLIMRQQGTGRLLLIATKRGVVQRDAGGGWEFFDFVNRVPWYWDLENMGEACVMFRLIDAD